MVDLCNNAKNISKNKVIKKRIGKVKYTLVITDKEWQNCRG
jgi:hypothetical protein